MAGKNIKEQKNTQIVSSRTLPNNVEAEKNLLGCILVDSERTLEVVSSLCEDDFYAPSHKKIFSAMKQTLQNNKNIEFVTVLDVLERENTLSQAGGIDYLATVNSCVLSAVNFQVYVDIIVRCATMRKLIHACSDIVEEAYTSDNRLNMLAEAEKKIYDIGRNDVKGDITLLGENVNKVFEKIDKMYQDPEAYRGLMTGFRSLDNCTNGLQGGNLVVLAARPGVGKSSLAMNFVANMAQAGKSVVVYSLEMSNEELTERMLCSMAVVSMSREKSGKLSPQDYNNLFIAGQVLSKLKIYGNESAGVKPADILSQCRRLKSHEDLDLIVIDYIQLMKGDEQTAESRQVEVSNITRSLKIIAKELKVPVLALSQLKRDVETRKEGGGAPNQPMLSDLRESGSIEQDADIVMFLNPHKADATEPNIFPVDLMVAKHRNGQTPTIPLTWLGPIVRFVESDGRSMEIEKKVREQLGQAPVVSESAVVIETPTYVDAPEEVGEEPLNTSDAHNIEE